MLVERMAQNQGRMVEMFKSVQVWQGSRDSRCVVKVHGEKCSTGTVLRKVGRAKEPGR